ncbi:MAG: protein kinase [Alphaproteobacteria bacterium]|nr:protein kinase [Alphaproteobacteria bacterium]
MSLRPGDRIDRYVIEAVLGEGGMAVVYRARHVELESMHALKVLHLSSAHLRERAIQEGRIQAQVRHPNIVAVTDVVRTADGAPVLVLEYVDGPSLEGWLAHNRPTLEQIDALVDGILAGVSAAHAHGLVHRDLKPDNVLLMATVGGRIVPKVADFGLAKVASEVIPSKGYATRSGVMMGTPDYMAPEQIRSAKHVDQRADVFALGAILYRMTTGRMPFRGGDVLEVMQAVSTCTYTHPRSLIPDLPDRMVRAIEGALVVDPDLRIADCARLRSIWFGDSGAEGPRTVDAGAIPSESLLNAPSWPSQLAPLPPGYDPVAASQPTRMPSEAVEQDPLEDTRETFPLEALNAPQGAQTIFRPEGASAPSPTLSPTDAQAQPARSRGLWLAVGAGVVLAAMVLCMAGPPSIGPEAPPSDPVATGPSREAPAADQPVARVSDHGATAAGTEEGAPTDPEPSHDDGLAALDPVDSTPTVQEAPPPPTPARDPVPAPRRSGGARVSLAGDLRAYLINRDSGDHYPATAAVPPGDYALHVFFDESKATPVMDLSLTEGETRSIQCQEMMRVCR